MLTADAKNLFGFDEKIVYLNHGGFGVAPRAVMTTRAKELIEIEKNPTWTIAHQYLAAWEDIHTRIAERFSVRREDLTLIDNVTDGINAIFRSFPLASGDEIITTKLTYGSIHKAATIFAKQQGAHVTQIDLPFPNPDPQHYTDIVKRAITSRTKLVVLDHITSSTALVLPITAMAKVCRDRGVAVLVDGAHAPGNITFDIKSIGADWYVANLHKWYFAPRGCGFLWAAPEWQKELLPNVLSWHADKPFPHNFQWQGTRDQSIWRSIPAAFDFMDNLGEENVRWHNHALIRQGMALISQAWNVPITTPDSMIGSMGLVPLPEGMPFTPDEEGRLKIERELSINHGISVSPSFADKGRIWLRISAQIYNDIGDYEKLAKTVMTIQQRGITPSP